MWLKLGREHTGRKTTHKQLKLIFSWKQLNVLLYWHDSLFLYKHWCMAKWTWRVTGCMCVCKPIQMCAKYCKVCVYQWQTDHKNPQYDTGNIKIDSATEVNFIKILLFRNGSNKSSKKPAIFGAYKSIVYILKCNFLHITFIIEKNI